MSGYADGVYGYAHAIVSDHDEALDMTRHVFAELERLIDGYEKRDVRFGVWIQHVVLPQVVEQAHRCYFLRMSRMTPKASDPIPVAMNAEEPKVPAYSEGCLKLAEEALTWREVDGEIVVLDRRSWMYMGVNGSGMLLWKLIVEGASLPRLVESLRDAYELDAEVAQRDVEAFLELLSSHNLLVEDAAG